MKLRSFDEILNDALLSYESVPEFVRQNYPAANFDTKTRTIRRYQMCEVIPKFDAARELLERLNVQCSEADLVAALTLSKEKRIRTSERYHEPLLIKQCNVKASDCFKGQGYSLADKDSLVAERIAETTKTGTQSEYIARLIENDVNKRVLPNYMEEKEREF